MMLLSLVYHKLSSGVHNILKKSQSVLKVVMNDVVNLDNIHNESTASKWNPDEEEVIQCFYCLTHNEEMEWKRYNPRLVIRDHAGIMLGEIPFDSNALVSCCTHCSKRYTEIS